MRDDGLVLVEGALEENELGELPIPADGRDVGNHLLGVRLAVAQHADLLAEHPAEQPVDLVRVVHHEESVLGAGLRQILLAYVHFEDGAAPPLANRHEF